VKFSIEKLIKKMVVNLNQLIISAKHRQAILVPVIHTNFFLFDRHKNASCGNLIPYSNHKLFKASRIMFAVLI